VEMSFVGLPYLDTGRRRTSHPRGRLFGSGTR
jgi:hypothetical protein